MDYIGKRKIWYTISLLILIPGILSLFIQGLNKGIDFTGGSLLEIRFEKPVSTDSVRQVIAGFGLPNAIVQDAGDNQFLIRTPELNEEQNSKLLSDFQEKIGKTQILRNEKVGGVIGKELTRNAVLAIIISAVLMVIYITVRFQFYFGLAAILALLHDALVVLGIFSLFQIEIDSTFVAALLTLLGYSINDTIVVFDRIRENLNMKKKEALAPLVNKSISQVLVRSINTVLTVILALVALLIFGGETTKVFAFTLLIGTVLGTASSIFVASPLWVDLSRFFGKGRSAANAAKTS